MSNRTKALNDDEVQGFLEASRSLFSKVIFRTQHGLGLLATPPDGKYPYVDIRSVCVAISAFSELGDHPTARALTRSLLALQGPNGAWAPSYTPDGTALPTPPAEDVTAMVLWAVMGYVRSSGDDQLASRVREQIEEATRYTRARVLNPYLYLVETSSSLHGTTTSSGYELWNNCAHAAAFALCHRIYGGERYRRLALLIRRAIGQLMTMEGRFLRRLEPNGYPDPRSDVAIMAPYYFGLWSPTERSVMNSAELIERTLWNVEIGGYIAALPFSQSERSSLPGPAPRFAGWMAQYHYELGNRDRAEAIMRWLFDSADNGRLAEVMMPQAAVLRFSAEYRRALREQAAREPDLAPYLGRILKDLDAVETAVERRSVAASGVPFLWSHLEVLRALRRGGYLDQWELGSPTARLGGEGPAA